MGTYSNRKIAIGLAVVVAVVAAIVVPTTRWMHTVTAKQDAVTARQDRIEELLTGHPPSADAGTPSPASTLFKGSGNYAFPVGPITGTLGQGTYPAPAPASTIQWGTAVTAPQLAQASEASATKGADMLFTPQQSTQATNEGGGKFVVNLQASIGSGVESMLQVTRAGVEVASIGPYSQAQNTIGGLWLGSAAPSTSNIALFSDGSTTEYVNAPTGGQLALAIGGGAKVSVTSTLSVGIPTGGYVVPFAWATTATAIACGTGGTQTITAAQAITPGLNVSANTLTSNCTLDFTTNASTGWFLVNLVNIGSLSTFSLIFKNGAATTSLTQTQYTALQTAGENGVQVWLTATPSVILL